MLLSLLHPLGTDSAGSNGVIPMNWIMLAVERWKDWNESGRAPLLGAATMGVDVARRGNDATVLTLAKALCITDIYEHRKNRTTQTAGQITQHASRVAKINIEGDAYGSAVYDILRENGIRHARTIAPQGSTTLRDRSGQLGFLNNRAAMWWNMRELLDPESGELVMLPDHPRLIGDLAAPTWGVNARGLIQVEKKEDIIKRIGRSPDFGDSCCLAFFPGGRGGGIVF